MWQYIKVYFNIFYIKCNWIINMSHSNVQKHNTDQKSMNNISFLCTRLHKRFWKYYRLWLEINRSVLSVELYIFFFIYCIGIFCPLWTYGIRVLVENIHVCSKKRITFILYCWKHFKHFSSRLKHVDIYSVFLSIYLTVCARFNCHK